MERYAAIEDLWSKRGWFQFAVFSVISYYPIQLVYPFYGKATCIANFMPTPIADS